MNKDLIIGILVTYVSCDILLGFIIYKNNPSILSNLEDSMNNSKSIIAICVSIVIGCLLSNCFGYRKINIF